MRKTFKTYYLFTTKKETKALKSAAKKCSSEFSIKFHKRNQTVDIVYNGKAFKGLYTHSKDYPDTVFLESPVHDDILVKDLAVLGTFFQIDGSKNINYRAIINLTEVDYSGHSIFFTTDLNFQRLKVRMIVDYRDHKYRTGVDSVDHKRILDYLSNHPAATILHDGIMEDWYYQQFVTAYQKTASFLLNDLTKYWPIIVEVDIHHPKNVKEIIERVERIYKEVMKNA